MHVNTAHALALIIHLHTVPYELTVNYINYYSLMIATNCNVELNEPWYIVFKHNTVSCS